MVAMRAGAVPADPAARGLDAFIHGSTSAPSGGSVKLDIATLGFAQVTTPSPVGGVAIDAVWNPTSFGEVRSSAPPAVHAESDATGRATMVVPMPEGDARGLELLVGLRFGAHARTRAIKIERTKAIQAVVHVSERTVVPGALVNAWVHVTRATSDAAVPNAAVEVEPRYEGSYTLTKLQARTDLAGMALVRVRIPDSDDPSDVWELRATAQVGDERASAAESLRPRDETPGSPWFDVRFDAGSVRAGAPRSLHLSRCEAQQRRRPSRVSRCATGSGRTACNPRPTPRRGTRSPRARPPISAVRFTRKRLHRSWSLPMGRQAFASSFAAISRGQQLEARGVHHRSSLGCVGRAHAGGGACGAGCRAGELLLRVTDGEGAPVSAGFDVDGDGLKTRVKSDAYGEAEIVWSAPANLGALRETGPCAGGVAASVTVRPVAAVEALRSHPEPFTTCVPIDREARALLVADKHVVRVGETLALRVVDRDSATHAWSIALGRGGTAVSTVWIGDGARGGSIVVPNVAPGVYDLSAAAPMTSEAAHVAHTSVLVMPASIPHLEAKVVGGRAAPGGTVDVDATLTDESGKPLMGTVTAMLVDLEGGGSLDGLVRLDTHRHLCDVAGASNERCAHLLSGDASWEPMRRALLGPVGTLDLPVVDPGGSARRELDEAFSSVLHSLEGAVYASSLDPSRLIDVRRKVGNASTFNPELMSLTTAAMDSPPVTPGGEPLSLGDLTAVDSQVTFDTVATRVTRYKLFKVLQAVRAFRTAHALDADEPALKDPNALLRRIVRTGELESGMLVDAWGGSMQFARTAGPRLPFLGVSGFELRAPGPNGVLGDGDDIHDPFMRVVRSGTPYARAMSEDTLVDAKLDMEVSEATVSAWDTVMQSATGTQLGLIGRGEGGGGMGQGFGSGHGRLSGGATTRSLTSLTNGEAFFQPPTRTDAQGHVRFTVPLGDVETTWGIGLLALPDDAPAAATKVDIVASQPVSVAANAGAVWTVGDEMDVRIIVRNRTKNSVEANLDVTTSGAAATLTTKRTLRVPPESIDAFPVRVRARSVGEAALVARLRAAGLPDDSLRFSWAVLPAGEAVTRTAAQWVEGPTDVKLDVDRRDALMGQARLVLARGGADALDGALTSLEGSVSRAPTSLADAMEVGALLESAGSPDMHERATRLRRVSSERLLSAILDASVTSSDSWLLARRLRAHTPAGVLRGKTALESSEDVRCPPSELVLAQPSDVLAVVPATGPNDVELPCWETVIAEATGRARVSNEPTVVARAVLALAERPERAVAARALVERLRTMVRLGPSGAMRLDHGSRSDRALVYAALLRGNKLGVSPVVDDRLAAWIAVDRDASGSFGSSEATRAVVQALVASGALGPGPSQTIVVEADGIKRTLTLGPSGALVLSLGERTTAVRVRASAGVVARLERPMLRSFAHPPDPNESPLRLEVRWPDDARAGHIASVHVTLSSVGDDTARVVARIPLPPGASMVGPIADVTQVHGALLVAKRVSVGHDAVVDVPLRFSLGGHATVREARIVTPRAALPRGIARAASFTVR